MDAASRPRLLSTWTTAEKVIGLCFVTLVVFVVAQTVYFVSTDRAADRRADARATAQRQCLAAQVEGIRTYLQVRGAIAERDRASVTAVIDSFSDAAESGDTSGILKKLEEYKKVQRQVTKDRQDTALPDFPSGRCVDIPGKTVLPTPTPTPTPTPSAAPDEDEAQNDDAVPASQQSAGSTPKDKPKKRKPSAPARASSTPPASPNPSPTVVDDFIPLPDIALPDIDIPAILDGIGDLMP